ncbi:MAG: DoxX family membrane protein [Verrucomicrobiales bacterium]|jgi:uncharacterized membrane protein YphA (DoxX/SURF4 family)|nr:DoxX family membrane protein [Verrucomicrobiales bacterium]
MSKATLILRWVLGLVFVYAGVMKIMAPTDFVASLQTFRFIPVWLIKLAVMTFPMFELVTGILLCLRIWFKPALCAVNGMCLLFLAALTVALIRGEPVDCGCFGAGQISIAHVWLALGRDVLLLAAGLFLYIRALRR